MKKSTKTKAEKLCPKGKQDLEAHGGTLAIENMLCKCDMLWVDPNIGRINHDWNANMFFDWKGAWVEGADITKYIEAFGGKDSCKSLA